MADEALIQHFHVMGEFSDTFRTLEKERSELLQETEQERALYLDELEKITKKKLERLDTLKAQVLGEAEVSCHIRLTLDE